MAKSYLLKITLLDIKPPVWRRFVVPADIKLDELHDVIQNIMDWNDCHLHAFDVGSDVYGPHMDDDWAEPIGRDESQYKLSSLVNCNGMKFRYTYDFGDSWEHQIVLEDSDYINPDWPYPIYCLDGKRACPPEDSGGAYGYGDSTDDDEDWFGDFDPEKFDLAEINALFKIPKKKTKELTAKPKRRPTTKRSPKNPASEMPDITIEWIPDDSDKDNMAETERVFAKQINKLKTIVTEICEKIGPEGSPQEFQDALVVAMLDADIDSRIRVSFSTSGPIAKAKRKSAKKAKE